MANRNSTLRLAHTIAPTRRGVARPLRQSARWQSTATKTAREPPQSFWTTGRVLLFSTFTGSLTYLYGIKDTSSSFRFTQPQTQSISPSSSAYATKPALEKAIAELRAKLGEDAISTDDEVLHNHGYSEWSSVNITTLPVAVAYPKNTAEVSEIAKCCSANRIPLIPYSGGSSLEANFSAPMGGISVDFAHMDNVLALRPDDMDVTVQPAVGWMTLNEKIKDSGLFFPVDPVSTQSASETIMNQELMI